MASEISTHFTENILHGINVSGEPNVQGDGGTPGDMTVQGSAETYTRRPETDGEGVASSSSYTLASNISQLSGDVDRWLTGSNISAPTASETTGIQSTRIGMNQQSTLTSSSCQYASSFWYLMAVVLPIFSVHNCVMQLRCTPSTVINVAELLFHQLARVCHKVREHVQRLARDQIARDVFAAAMDVVLVVYALGFLVLSMYQASIIG